MPKIKINVYILTNEDKTTFEANAIICDGLLKYREPNNTLVIFDYNNKALSRENDELKMNYKFDDKKKTIGELIVKELNKNMTLELTTEKINIKDNDIQVNFKVEENNFEYKIEEIK